MQHFFDVYQYWGIDSHEFTLAEVDDFEEPGDFTDLALVADGAVKLRVDAFRALVPQAPAPP